MKKRRFAVKRRLEKPKLLLVILLIIAVISGALTVLAEYYYRRYDSRDVWNTRVYRSVHHIELDSQVAPIINIYMAGMPVEIAVWDGDTIKLQCVSELPLIIDEEIGEGFLHEITVSQDDGFAISFFTLDMFRYNLKVYLPRWAQYEQINIVSSGGNVRINGHHLSVLNTVNIETNNASVDVIRGTSTYYIRTQSGDIFMDFDFLVSTVMINSNSGNVELRIPDTDMEKADELLKVVTHDGEFVLIEKKDNIPLL
jgi:hypothetical protein